MVMLVPTDAFAGTEALREPLRHSPGEHRRLERADDEGRAVLLREQQRLLGCHRVTARLRVVAHVARGRLRVAPFADVALVSLGACGELGRRERAMGRELAVQTEPVADDDERRHGAAAEVDDRAAK